MAMLETSGHPHIESDLCMGNDCAALVLYAPSKHAASAPRECMGDFATVDSDEAQSNCWRFGKVTK